MTSVGSCRQGWWVCAPSWLIPTQEPPTQGRGEASAWPPGADQSLRSGGPASGASCWRCVCVRVCACALQTGLLQNLCVSGWGRLLWLGVLGGGTRGWAGWGRSRGCGHTRVQETAGTARRESLDASLRSG